MEIGDSEAFEEGVGLDHHQDADSNNGSHDGRWGGADQITEPENRLALGVAVEAKALLPIFDTTGTWANGETFSNGGDDSVAVWEHPRVASRVPRPRSCWPSGLPIAY